MQLSPLNVKKTKLLVAGVDPDEVHNIEIDGETVQQVDHFKYLGSTKYNDANCSKDIKSRIAIGKRRMIDLQVLWNDRNLSMPLKMKLVKTLVWSGFAMELKAGHFVKQMKAESWHLKCGSGGECLTSAGSKKNKG